MHPFINAVLGGGLIGLAATVLLLSTGRVAGISGILGDLLAPPDENSSWRFSFVLGLLAGGGVLAFLSPQTIQIPQGRNLAMLAIAGGIVGFGTRQGNGCTSGHGVCGLTRFSKRSLVATITFMVTGVITASIVGQL